MADSDAPARPQVSTRDLAEVHDQLVAWLASRLPEGADPQVSELSIPSTNGMSSETLLFDASWTEDGATRTERCVVRMRPALDAKPVFPTYDLDKQYRVMSLVAERCGVPVPKLLWNEPEEAPLGAPFFVMRRADGSAPPDVMPYTIDSWLLKADAADRRRLQEASVAVVADIHQIDVTADEMAFLQLEQPGDSALRRHLNDLKAFYEWGIEGRRVPLLDRAFQWLEDNFPEERGEDVISWGDARIGNILYVDFAPTAVLDWEMAAVGPRELDLAWMVFIHDFFQDIATRYGGLPGIPDLLRREDVYRQYTELTGYQPRDTNYFEVYAAVRHGVVMARIAHRQEHFGERVMPENLDETVLHRGLIEQMLEGTYWDNLPAAPGAPADPAEAGA
ncbi:phosphotransferase family protein [Yinghuangia seranimata]|uniref:phosphotransferase family protein n=1 Tax=Yinghuangia seranimata TaxID=408067 RepID=UPI00248B8966|nr:phosphotransferase family protein [Yinghuangia seranimata]MDI2132571.1 phosphotransferase family protein [Yinghuangia seranimata]